jgi:hypothetical protein
MHTKLIRKSEGKRSFGRPGYGWEIHGVNWMQVVQGLGSIKSREFLDFLSG